jgi:hypothetical protein
MVNDEIWLAQLEILAKAGDRNPLLCGSACSILVERGKMTDAELGVQISRYLSPGSASSSGAAWFEGLAMRNRQLLLLKPDLWKQLDAYIAVLDDEAFKRSLVCLRRTFALFTNAEKGQICSQLAQVWQLDATEALLGSLGEAERAQIKAAEEAKLAQAAAENAKTAQNLNDFDFSDLL